MDSYEGGREARAGKEEEKKSLIKVKKKRQADDAASSCMIKAGLPANTDVLQHIDSAFPVSDC